MVPAEVELVSSSDPPSKTALSYAHVENLEDHLRSPPSMVALETP